MDASPNWAEIVTAIGTAVGALGLLGAIGAAVFAGQQVREARIGRQAEAGGDFLRRWNDESLVEARRLVDGFATPGELTTAFRRAVTANDEVAATFFRELDYFEQLGALEQLGVVDFDLVRLLLGRRLVTRWLWWKPALDATFESQPYPMFESLAAKMESALVSAERTRWKLR